MSKPAFVKKTSKRYNVEDECKDIIPDKIVLASKSALKLESLKTVIEEIELLDGIPIEHINCDNELNPPQPINSGIQCARNRLSHLYESSPKVRNVIYISIENSVETNYDIKARNWPNSTENRSNDIAYVVLHFNDKEFTSESVPIPNPEGYLEKAVSETPKDFNPLGLSITLGKLISGDFPDFPADNWMANPSLSPKYNRNQQIHGALISIFAKLFIDRNLLYFGDFPVPGVLFKDMSAVLQNQQVFNLLDKAMVHDIVRLGWVDKIDQVGGLDARGFIYGPMIAQSLNKGFVMLRKKGKLPGEQVVINYHTEYSQDEITVMRECVKPGERFLLVDDIQATGGTMRAGMD